MSFSFKYYKTNGTEVDVSNKVVYNSIVIARRCDEAFAKGSCQIIMQEPNNIPPFSIANINGDKYLISSTATLYQPMCSSTTKYYVHDCELMELSAILEGFILGTKVESSDIYDRAKITILRTLVGNKYNVTFVDDFNMLALSKNEYSFGNGTTLWDALSTIMMRVNCRPVVKDITYSDNTKSITLGDVYLSSSQTDYSVNINDIVQWTKTQSQDNYCEVLETEANNVIDTTNLAYDRNLTERSLSDTRLTETANGTGKLYTTNKINKVTKLEVNTYTMPQMTGMFGADFFSTIEDYVIDGNTGIYGCPDWMLEYPIYTLKHWCEISAPTGTSWNQCQLYTFFEAWCQVSGVDFEELLECPFELVQVGRNTFTKNGITFTDNVFALTGKQLNPNTNTYEALEIQARGIDITNQVLEKSQYDAEADCQKPKYCYYTQGTNVIDGLHLEIDTALWNQIAAFFTGTFRGPLMPDYVTTNYMPPAMSEVYSGTGFYTGKTTTITGTLNMYNHPFSYNVQYEAVTNPSMVVKKTDTPVNESNYKHIARSYGVSANQIDYDKLVKSMKMSNDMLGKVEHTIEIKLPDSNLVTIPQLANRIKQGSTVLGYLLNYEIKYNVSYKSMVMYITSSVQNVANAIGIPYQYHATRNAIEGIVERPIRIEQGLTIEQYEYILGNADKLMIYFTFYKLVGSTETRTNVLITRACLMTQNNKTILYCEALDQYCFGYRTDYDGNNVVNKPVTYADSNNEIYSMDYAIGCFKPTMEMSRRMPQGLITDYQKFPIHSDGRTVIYKDQKEKLTFTIEIKEEE